MTTARTPRAAAASTTAIELVPGQLGRRDNEGRALVEDRIRKSIATCVVADDAGAAGMHQGLVGTLHRTKHRLQARQVVCVGRVDDAVRCACLSCKHFLVFQAAEHGLDPVCTQEAGLGGVSHQPSHRVSGGDEADSDAAADVSGGAGDEQSHPRAGPVARR